MMMTTRPWPPVYQQSRPFSPTMCGGDSSGAASKCAAGRDQYSKSFHQNGSRYGMALRRDYKPSNCYFSAAPIYHRTPFAPVPVPCMPTVRMLARHMLLLEAPPPPPPPPMTRERPLFRHQQQPFASKCSCSCLKVRSRSLENLCPSDVTTSTTTEDREVLSRRRRKPHGKENFKRRSMDNLLEGGRVCRKKVSCGVGHRG